MGLHNPPLNDSVHLGSLFSHSFFLNQSEEFSLSLNVNFDYHTLLKSFNSNFLPNTTIKTKLSVVKFDFILL